MYKIIIFLIVILVNMSGVLYAEDTIKLYNDAVSSINKWLESIPKNQYQKATSDEIFRWKVEIEKAGGIGLTQGSEESYDILRNVAKEINNRQFVYQNIVVNKNSLHFFQLQNYVLFYNKGYTSIPKPKEIFMDSLDYYKTNIKNIREQWEWLFTFMQVLSYQRYYVNATLGVKNSNSSYIDNLANNYSDIISIVTLYFTIGDNLLRNNPKVLLRSGRFYYEHSVNSFMDDLEKDVFLGQIYNFCFYWEDYLKDDDKKMILNFVLPKYQDNDYAVKIYSVLAED